MSRRPIKTVLLVEDDLGDARPLREMPNEHGPQNTEATHAASMREAESHLAGMIIRRAYGGQSPHRNRSRRL